MNNNESLFLAKKIYNTAQLFYNSSFNCTGFKRSFVGLDYEYKFSNLIVFSTENTYGCFFSFKKNIIIFDNEFAGIIECEYEDGTRNYLSRIMNLHQQCQPVHTKDNMSVLTIFSYLAQMKCQPFYMDLRII